jgi:hypothetical protein
MGAIFTLHSCSLTTYQAACMHARLQWQVLKLHTHHGHYCRDVSCRDEIPLFSGASKPYPQSQPGQGY